MVKIVGFMAYSICHQQPCNNMENVGSMVLMLGGWCIKDPRHENTYSSVGLDLVAGGGHGSDFNASREAWEFGLKCWIGSTCVSFGLSLVCLSGFKVLGAILRNAIARPLS